MINISVPLQKIEADFIAAKGITLYVYRLDMNHVHISGNKIFKLHYNMLDAVKQGKRTILTYGGAFSNHIAATAATGKEQNFRTIGIIRGEEYEELNPTLKFAKSCGMELHYVPRTLYKNRLELQMYVKEKFGTREYYEIPEGGANLSGVLGCKEITNNIPVDFDVICCACGTGTTLSGIILSLKEHQQAIGFQILKAEGFIEKEVGHWLKKSGSNQQNWSINEDHHFGGYAKINNELSDFIRAFEKENTIPLDYIYTGKMMFGIYEMIQKGEITKGQTVIALHTGGLQGNSGYL